MAASLGYVYRTDVDQSVHEGIHDGMQKYENKTQHDGIDFMQKEVCIIMASSTNDTPQKNTTTYPLDRL